MTTKLFSPLKLRDLTLENRIVVSPMLQHAAENGVATDWHLMHYGMFSVSGPGLLITEATATEPRGRIGPYCMGLYSDEAEKALARVVGFCRKFGNAKLGVQLAHSGRKGSVPPTWVPRRTLTPEEGGWRTVSCSPIDDEVFAVPEVLDQQGIEAIIDSWSKATYRAERIGFDLIELHFAHGYLAHQFLSPLTNERTDCWGGTRAARMKFALKIFGVCRKAWPSHKPMGVRISAVDWVPGGWDLEDSVVLAKELKARGCDYVCTSSGGASSKQQIVAGPNYQVPFAERIRSQAGIATIAVGQITEPRQAEEILQKGQADLVALARRMLFNPRWPWHAAEELGEYIAYPPRYLLCHPRRGAKLQAPESQEHTLALLELAKAEEKAKLSRNLA